jgi:hypothetical protein
MLCFSPQAKSTALQTRHAGIVYKQALESLTLMFGCILIWFGPVRLA